MTPSRVKDREKAPRKRRVAKVEAPDPRAAAVLAAQACDEKQATDIKVLEVTELIFITDYFVIASGQTERQVHSICDEVEKSLNSAGLRTLRREGERDGRWVLLDFADVVVHVFAREEREYYELERLWKDAPEIAWSGGGGETAVSDPGASSQPELVTPATGSSATTRRRART